MCRILIATGEGEKLRELALAMRSASHRDPYKASRGRGWSHRDGWGYLLVTRDGLQHYRSTNSLPSDSAGFETLLNSISDGSILMMHSRAASQGEISLINTQPFVISTEGGAMAWLIHNGDLDREAVAGMLERGPGEDALKGLSDSYVLAMYVGEAMRSAEGDVSPFLMNLTEHVKTTLNAALLVMRNKSIRTTVVAYSNPDYAKDPRNWNYSRVIHLEEPAVMALASSTLELYYRGPWRTLKNGTVVSFEINRDRLRPEEMEFREYPSG